MSANERLVMYMMAKDAILTVEQFKAGHDSERYFYEEDAKAILAWPEDEAAQVLNKISFGTDYGMCPFCCRYVHDNGECECFRCEYGEVHGKCWSNGNDSYTIITDRIKASSISGACEPYRLPLKNILEDDIYKALQAYTYIVLATENSVKEVRNGKNV